MIPTDERPAYDAYSAYIDIMLDYADAVRIRHGGLGYNRRVTVWGNATVQERETWQTMQETREKLETAAFKEWNKRRKQKC